MSAQRVTGTLAAALACVAFLPAGASASARRYECQKPVMTGVEVYGLHDVSAARACAPALALFAWENASQAHAESLYGCHRPRPDEAGYPYLKLHSFEGWRLSLVGKPYGEFTMSRGASSFHVSGTDFPLNCS
jgi:hypothetical protein